MLPVVLTAPAFTVAATLALPLLVSKLPRIVPATLTKPGVKTLPAVTLPVVDMGFDPNAARLAATLALPYVPATPVNKDPLPIK